MRIVLLNRNHQSRMKPSIFILLNLQNQIHNSEKYPIVNATLHILDIQTSTLAEFTRAPENEIHDIGLILIFLIWTSSGTCRQGNSFLQPLTNESRGCVIMKPRK